MEFDHGMILVWVVRFVVVRQMISILPVLTEFSFVRWTWEQSYRTEMAEGLVSAL
jgi:hypothetical protein